MKKLIILPLVFAATTMFSQCYKKIENEVQAKYRVGKLKIIIDYSTPDDVSRANLESIGNN